MALDYSKWLQSLRDVATRLASRGVQVELTIEEPTPDEDLAGDEGYLGRTSGQPGFRYDPALRALYSETRSVRFKWKTHDTPEFPPMFGSMRLLPLVLLYDPGTGEVEPWHGVWRVLDETGTGTQTLVQFDPQGTMSLAYRVIEGDTQSLTPLSLGLDEYLEMALATCCKHYWQLLFASEPNTLTRDQLDDFYADLEALSPPADPDAVRRLRGG